MDVIDGIYFSLPYIDPITGQGVITPHYDARTGQSFYPWETNIVPVEDTPAPSSRETTVTRSYEEPAWIDTINRAIERAAQVATLEVAGYPPYPNFPTPSPTPIPMPVPTVAQGVQPQSQGVQLSNTTLMLIVGGALLFMLGKRGR